MTRADTATGRLLLFQKLVGAWVTGSVLSAQSKTLGELNAGFCITRAAFTIKIRLLIQNIHLPYMSFVFQMLRKLHVGNTCLFCLVGCLGRAIYKYYLTTSWYIYCIILLYAKHKSMNATWKKSIVPRMKALWNEQLNLGYYSLSNVIIMHLLNKIWHL